MKTKSKVQWMTPQQYMNWGTNVIYLGKKPVLPYMEELAWIKEHAIKNGLYRVRFPDGTEEDIHIVNLVEDGEDYDHGNTTKYTYEVPHFEIIHNELKFHSRVYGGKICKILQQPQEESV
jgi:hypothetical protein